ncbi:MAG: ankyrin repeat domain-containing protein [Acidobacteriota bacterium]
MRAALFLCALLAGSILPANLLGGPSDGSRLVDAVKHGDAAAVHALLRARVDVNAPEGDGTTALHWAVQADDAAMARMLIQAGAKASAANRLGVTPMVLAATNGSAALLGLLLEAGANANEASVEGETVLMTATRTGKLPAVERLLKAGADVNAVEKWRGETALMWAAAENHGAVVTALVKAGAHLDQQSRILNFPDVKYNLATHATLPPPQGGFTALMFAARQGAIDAVRALADAGANLNLQDPDGTPALALAVVNVHHDVAALLLERGADPNVTDVTGMTPLYAAVELHTVEMYPERRPLRKSANRTSTLDLMKLLLAKGATPDAPLKGPTLRWGRRRGPGDGALGQGATPLMRAARLADVAAMRVLLDGGADISRKLKDGTTVLMLAAGAGWRTGETILGGKDYGPESDTLEAVRLCLEKGASVNDVDANGVTALHDAVVRGPDVLRLLLDHGATLDVKDKRGRTPLDVAQGVRAPGEAQRMNTSPLREASAAFLRRSSGAANAGDTHR